MPNANPEPQRLSLYLPEALLDAAEEQALRAGVKTVQEYCAELLSKALQAEQIREQVSDVEARRGALEGLQEIANDPEYLVEWSAQATPREVVEPPPIRIQADSAFENPQPPALERPSTSIEMPESISQSGLVVLHHAGQGEDDPSAFLPCLRRGQSVSVNDIADLARALQTLEIECREARSLNRRVAFALHRLAYEGQILHTDAWPGVFDDWTVDTLHAVQEAVERILSGQDIRYYPTNP